MAKATVTIVINKRFSVAVKGISLMYMVKLNKLADRAYNALLIDIHKNVDRYITVK